MKMNTIFTDGMRFVDEFGRERIFHGINVCDKGRKVGGTGRREYDCEWDEALFEQFRNCGFQPDTDWYYHCEFILDTFDKYHWSDTYRAYFDGLSDYQLHEKVLKRPYPRAVAGRIIEYRSIVPFRSDGRQIPSPVCRESPPARSPCLRRSVQALFSVFLYCQTYFTRKK